MCEFNFKSSVCTSKEQSERLLALGLKKETADMTIVGVFIGTNEDGTLAFDDIPNAHPPILKKDIPAWSLHRLIEMMPKSIHFENEDWYKIIYNNSVCYQRGQFSICRSCKGDLYEDIANCIKWLIKEGYFNKEYLA